MPGEVHSASYADAMVGRVLDAFQASQYLPYTDPAMKQKATH